MKMTIKSPSKFDGKGFAKEVTLRYFSYYLLHLIQNIVIFNVLNSLEPTPSLLYFLVNIGLVV